MSYIYKLTDCNGLNYYGSSVNPDKRFNGHKCSGNQCSSNKLDRLSMVMEIIEELPESYTADDVLWRERWYFDNFECVNENRPILSDEERKETEDGRYEYNKRPEVMAKRKENDKRPDVKAKMIAYNQRADVKAKRKLDRERPEAKAKMKEKGKALRNINYLLRCIKL